ncbi:MAG: TonB-dependent receptor plug domain-containing protein [Cellvibrionaceae bacterium]
MFKKEIKKYFYIAISIFGAAGVSQNILADIEDELEFLYGDEETVSIATGTNKALRLAPSVASVITAEDIWVMGAKTLDDVIESIPGVHVSLGARNSSLYSIRGIHTSYNPQVLMLVDGFPMTELFTGGRVSNLIVSVRDIERVEVIRGPGSALYGADAFAGVINIITKKAKYNPDNEVGLSAGSFDSYEGWLNFSTEILGWDTFLSFDYSTSNGDKDRIIKNDGQTVLDMFYFTDASLAPGSMSTRYENIVGRLNLSKGNWYISASVMDLRDGGVGEGVAGALDPNGSFNADQQHLQAKYTDLLNNEKLQINAEFNYLRIHQDNKYFLFPPNALAPIGQDGNLELSPSASLVLFTDGLIGNPLGEDQNYSFEMSAVYTAFDRHSIRAAAGYKIQKEETEEFKNFGPGVIDGTQPIVSGTLIDVTGQSDYIYMDDQKRKIKYVSIQDEWAFYTDWELTLGVRFDDYSDFGNTTNPRLAVVWETTYNLTSKFIYGKAFRAPSFSEQFAKNNPSLIGTLDIDPEIIEMYELSFDYRFNYNLKTQLNIFYYKVDGLIDFVDTNGDGNKTAQNILDQDGHGLEMDVNWKAAENFNVAANYSWQNSENHATGEVIADAPEHLFYLDFRWELSRQWMVTNQWNYVVGRERLSTDLRESIDDYVWVDFNLISKNVIEDFEIHFSIKNIFDEEAKEPSVGPNASLRDDSSLEGRKFVLGGVYRF